MKTKRIKIGDVFEIPLSNRLKAYGQYVFKDIKIGPMIRVSELITQNEVSICQLNFDKLLFPPLFTGLIAAIRTGLWNIIGHVPVNNFNYPKFVSAIYDQKTGKVKIWYLWDGKEYTKIGFNLPEEYKILEYLIGWAPQDIATRIETGIYPFPYRELIQNNQFTPL